jgi:DNA-binding PucR family transcriptional regulator
MPRSKEAKERLDPTIAGRLSRLADVDDTEVDRIVEEAAADAGIDAGLLGEFPRAVLRAAGAGREPTRRELDRFHAAGEWAASEQIPLPAAIDLYLSTAWRLWRLAAAGQDASVPALAQMGELVLRAADDAVAAMSRGYVEQQRQRIRREEAARREFVDDLLSGTADVERLAEAATLFGVNLAGSHVVVVARAGRPLHDAGPVHGWVESQVFSRFGRDDVVVATKEGLLVCVFPASATDAADQLASFLGEVAEGSWRLAAGTPEPGPAGPARSYRRAVDTLTLGDRLEIVAPVLRYEDLRPFHLLARDPRALAEVVEDVLGGLESARGGAAPLVETIEAYVAESGNVTGTARRLFLTPRAVTYRIATIEKLTGRDLTAPDDRFVLELAARGRRLLSETRKP